MHIMAIRDKNKKNKRAMNSNRGSAAIIAIVFMMFLLIIGGSFMPLMSSELKHAGTDMDEQQAWYAAEAGIKFVKAYTNDADTIKDSLGQSLRVISDNDTVQYVLKVIDPTDNSVVTSSTSGFPVTDRKYKIYSEGDFNGVKKVITAEMAFAKSSSSGGESGGDNGGGTSGGSSANIPGVIQTEGKVTIKNSNQNIFGDIYAKSFTDERGDQGAGNHNKGEYPTSLATNIPESVFQQSSYGTLTQLDSTAQWNPIAVESGGKYIINWPLSYNWGYKFIGANDAFVFIHSSSPIVFYTTDGIVGPSSGKPITFVFDCAVTLNTRISGNVRILAKGDVTLGNVGDLNGLFMLLTNGDIIVNRSIEKGFLSSNGSVTLNNSCAKFVGQIQAKKEVTVYSGSLIYDNTVANSDGFVLPDGMK